MKSVVKATKKGEKPSHGGGPIIRRRSALDREVLDRRNLLRRQNREASNGPPSGRHAVRPCADMVAFSHIDLFRLTDRGPEYALTLQVADKVVGMDVLGDTLAVLVVRDAGGVIPERRVDWYDISGLTGTVQ